MAKNTDDLLFEAAEILKKAKSAIAFTGAGISVPSGIPDFRSPGGLWSRFDPMEVASLQALRSNPRAVWEFLLEAHAMFDKARPNPAHEALAQMEAAGYLVAVITQNIDGLHQSAGSKTVVEYHGGCTKFYCMSCSHAYPPEKARALTRKTIPWRCEKCDGIVRPNVVFFGEGIPPEAQNAAHNLLLRADAVIVVGTSGAVYPASLIPSQVKSRGGSVIEVNIGPTSFGQITDIRFDAPAEKILPALARLIC